MNKKAVGIAVMSLVALAPFVWQQVGQTAPALTALDYAEINQLYARNAFSADWDHDDGDMWASTFTEDGVLDITNPRPGWVTVQGHEALKTWWGSDNAIHKTPRHFTTNILTEPTPEGAMGTASAIIVGGAEDGQRPFIRAKWSYHDQLVKTPDGWRFKKRMLTRGKFSDELLQRWRTRHPSPSFHHAT